MNLPNSLTIFRIILVPFFMFFLLVKMPYGQFIAALIFIIAASTDGLDGYIARKRKQITNFGKIMDPLADKLLVSAALISLVELGKISGWIAVIIIGREFAVTGLRAVAASEGVVIAASKIGKYKTVSQIIAIIAILMNDFIINLIGLSLGQYLLYIAVFFTIYSGIDYFSKAGKLIKVG
ncbi:CDP-diacylglycerol--glycerol-3-phosphate 3-phosphatidyltransferase [Desulfonispora thiosulfatigenes DSM 11270]|uniref:CDP-diacylglycerol--glycerol-3-phosphate 3-phosphatidyltransferase n=1 Tax=Desulfonispora thiosulfatigenes DSM 11270 TaxID=656914 RepID=A0A1W1VSD6_DESTI|nr:CDP-diacylglycerol--glycerol-3-phosphate 3-phosphatidyltransferase [Desulfonispora thiosulfatigenes]SMB96292.1 CDP-diacylglycerol--glycerol-3-phosphate 3-phosphatidyltransferase [Desulfonispora thiosulfatigenes DSM 11270]